MSPDPLQQILEQALLQDSKQQQQQQQRQRQQSSKPQQHVLDFLYDNVLLPPPPSGGPRQASKPPKPASQAFQRLTAGLSGEWGSERLQQRLQDMDWSEEPSMLGGGGAAASGADSDGKGQHMGGQAPAKRSVRKRVSVQLQQVAAGGVLSGEHCRVSVPCIQTPRPEDWHGQHRKGATQHPCYP